MKYFLSLILIGSSLYSMEQAKANLQPIQKLSLLDSIKTGRLIIHANFYECRSFIYDWEHESTYFIPHKDAHEYFQEFLNTQKIHRDSCYGYERFVHMHQHSLKKEIQEEVLSKWTQVLKHTYFINLPECMINLMCGQKEEAKKNLKDLKDADENDIVCTIG